MKPFNKRGSLLIDRWTMAKERGSKIARLILRLLEWAYIGA